MMDDYQLIAAALLFMSAVMILYSMANKRPALGWIMLGITAMVLAWVAS